MIKKYTRKENAMSDVKLTKKEKELLSVVLSRSEDKRDHRGTIIDWKELTKLGFSKSQTKAQLQDITRKLLSQQVSFIVEKGRDAELVTYPVITRCRIMGSENKGWNIMFSVSEDVLARNVHSFARIEAQNDIAYRFQQLVA